MICTHGINHSGTRHGCDGCCKGAAISDPSECAGCAKAARHPGEGYVCVMHSHAAEVDSLRRQLAVTRAALAQCATALRGVQRLTDGVSALGWHGINEMQVIVTCALTPVDVEHAVRVEAARNAVIQAARTLVTWKDHLAFGLNKQRVIDSLAVLAALTSERSRDGGGRE